MNQSVRDFHNLKDTLHKILVKNDIENNKTIFCHITSLRRMCLVNGWLWHCSKDCLI